ncbi:hypothetical protein J6590_080429 [Homalodisca vitripennis]|nr:hypothetical protein J6590_080429 [Homalodisca vitripennis]
MAPRRLSTVQRRTDKIKRIYCTTLLGLFDQTCFNYYNVGVRHTMDHGTDFDVVACKMSTFVAHLFLETSSKQTYRQIIMLKRNVYIRFPTPVAKEKLREPI